jgi:aryl-alcohol dehydrogenase-like predicted oxidoreductase
MCLLDRFVNEGFNFIDTAETYSRWVPGNKGGESETISCTTSIHHSPHYG